MRTFQSNPFLPFSLRRPASSRLLPSWAMWPLKGTPLSPAAPDLKTMTERLRSRYYVTRKLFVADLQRVIANCREYNPPDSEYCRCASALEKFFYFKLKEGGLIDK